MNMLHELTITVDDAIYQTLKPMVEQETIDSFLREFMQKHTKDRKTPPITALRGTLHHIDTSDIREETDRPI
jgi:predicted CopG family antitoxin